MSDLIKGSNVRLSRVSDGEVFYLGTIGDSVPLFKEMEDDDTWIHFGEHTYTMEFVMEHKPETFCLLVGMSMVDYSIMYETHIVRATE